MSEISIIKIIPALRDLNNIYAAIIDNGMVSYSQQVAITEYYNFYNDIKAVERMILGLIVEMKKERKDLLLGRLAGEVHKNLHYYRSSPDLWLKLDIDQVCRSQGTTYANAIHSETDFVNGLYTELTTMMNELDFSGFKGLSGDEIEILDGRCDKLKNSYRQEKEKLSQLYTEQYECLMQASHYSANLFENIYRMHSLWISLLDCYQQSDIEEKECHGIKNDSSLSDIVPDMIFHTNMYARFLILEDRLKKDGYLSESQWTVRHKNGRQDIKSLVIFLIALLDNNYFLPNRDSRIKHFFECRYRVSIGQNFEPRRRLPLQTRYKQVFAGYPF